jgi:hypothetical protein
MEQIHVSPEVLEHARGAVIFDNGEWEGKPAVPAYRCKLYRARLALSSESRHPNSVVYNQIRASE